MKWFILCLLGLLLAACAPSSPTETPNIQQPPTAKELDVALNMIRPKYSLGMPITLRFVLHNSQEYSITFCYLNSPAHEMVWSNYFVVTNEAGHPMPYIGTNSLYQGQPDPQYFMTLAPDALKIYTIDLRTLYKMSESGRYSVRFVGDKINLLPNSTPARFILE